MPNMLIPTVPFSYYRGGTSKAVFFLEKDLPPPGDQRDKLILRLMGSPDRMQIDGMGGTHPVTSKVAIIKKSERENIDVDYLFAQVSIKTANISYDGGCGNISSAVGPFAINEGLVETNGSKNREVSIWMVGTQTQLIAHVPVNPKTRRAKEAGDYQIDGCPGTGAPILMDYKHTAGGAVKKGMLPTSNAIDEVEVRGRKVSTTICDIAHIIVFGKAEDFGIRGNETAADLNADEDLIARIREFRGRAASLVGLCSDWRKVDEEAPNLPYVILISATDGNEKEDIQARLFLDNHCHTSMAGAGAACTAACSRVPGSLVAKMAKKPLPPSPASKDSSTTFYVKHPLGRIPVEVAVAAAAAAAVDGENSTRQQQQLPHFTTLAFVRTARYIAKGELFIPEDFEGDDFPINGSS